MAVQLNFNLRTSANCKTVHLLGSWDNYTRQLPLSKDSSKSGAWNGAFRFYNSLKPGQRYWYYYIIDGYHVSHDPARPSVQEQTTGRKLNILDIPSSPSSDASKRSSRHSRRPSTQPMSGRSLSPSQIKCPRPVRPTETRRVRGEAFGPGAVDKLSRQFARSRIESESDSDSDSDEDSDVPSLTSRSSRSSRSSVPSVSSSSESGCSCNRYGITRSGHRVKLDCGGKQCGSYDSSSGSECSSDSEPERYPTRRYVSRR
ncbi:hypothetical protein K470DRAFT_261095 [Piedraia hortae CBS 480.64]|uniref:AMP-activated protein kinase glycogen-binding domain-containing protein n=1 Tax=Piedraia hortae CBS 480.64 TaxID=1314780 RepID=A0A6A7BP19_9PEZI|nr:hypothetical protein K470DRAFT_261095 [Piedraia hortae CBS 480.64]